MPAISFNHIPADQRVPLFYAEAAAAPQSPTLRPFTTVLFAPNDGVRGTAGNGAVPGDIADRNEVPTQIFSPAHTRQLFGIGSIARMADAYFFHNPGGRLFAYPATPAVVGPVQGTWAIHLKDGVATATHDDTLTIKLLGETVEVQITKDQTAATVRANITAALKANAPINEAFTVLPDSAQNYVKLTAKNKGWTPYQIGAADETGIYAGPISAGGILEDDAGRIVTQDSNPNSAAPTLTAANLNNIDYDLVVAYQETTSVINALRDKATEHWNQADGSFGHVISAYPATLTLLTSKTRDINGTPVRNSQHETIVGLPQNTYHDPAIIAADIAGAAAKSLALDTARPLQTLALKTPASAFAQNGRFSRSERNTMLLNNMSTLAIQDSGAVRIERLVTTYAENELGVADDSWYDMNTPFQLAYVMSTLQSVITNEYPRAKLVADNTPVVAGSNVVTPAIIKARLISAYGDLIDEGVVQNSAYFAENLRVEINADDPNRVDVIFPADLVAQLRVVGVKVTFNK